MRELEELISNYNKEEDNVLFLDFDKMTAAITDIVTKVKEEFHSPHQGTII